VTDRLLAFGTQLVETHDRLRELLSDIRSGDLPPVDLRTHCLSFCAMLTSHHEAEDEGAFPVLAREYPELAPILDELSRDHVLIADAMTRLRFLLRSDEDVQVELASLAALLETHLVYEEKKIVALLNTLRPDAEDAAALTRATTLDL
jgi:hemerythrin-like domain-containing protein